MRAAMADQFYDPAAVAAARKTFGDEHLSKGDLLALFIDPKRGAEVLKRRFAQTQIAAAGIRTGYDTSRGQDRYLASLGVTGDQAQQGFGQLVHSRELFAPLPGTAEDAIGQRAQLGAVFGGNTLAQERISKRARERTAAFEGSSAFAQGGIGSAQGA
jgi:hypothetical protein